jgi:uncharacterized membrane protein YhaH (DUF805 family)
MLVQGFGIDLIYTTVVVLSCLVIYFKTKLIYDLSGHKGIQYFRNAFLFFAIAFLSRFLIKVFAVTFRLTHDLGITKELSILFLFIFIYASSLAVFYLAYSVAYKKLKDTKYNVPLLHIISLFIALITLIFQSATLFILSQTILFIFAAIASYTTHKKSKNKTHLGKWYTIYILLLIFWILNLIDIAIPNFFRTTQLFIFTASAAIFILILVKVLEKTTK